MGNIRTRNKIMCSAALSWALVAFAPTALAQDANSSEDAASEDLELDTIVSIGSRVPSRSALDTPAPVDVLPGDEFVNQGTNDISDILRTAVPS